MNNYEDQYKQETGKYFMDFDGYTSDFVKWLTAKLTSETARADKAEGDRDELKLQLDHGHKALSNETFRLEREVIELKNVIDAQCETSEHELQMKEKYKSERDELIMIIEKSDRVVDKNKRQAFLIDHDELTAAINRIKGDGKEKGGE